jgi:D-xylose transport system substrate-binding protein
VLVGDEELAKRKAEGIPAVPPSQTPWQQLYRSTVGQMESGACMELAVTTAVSATRWRATTTKHKNSIGDSNMKKIIATAVLGAMMALAGGYAQADAKNPKIGFSIDDLRLERWVRDRDYFTAEAEKLGAKVYVQSADASEQRQISQIENLISRGVDVLVIVPYNATVLNNAVREAKKAKIKVVSYDRLILNADIDAYISFDNKVGELQAGSAGRAETEGQLLPAGRRADRQQRQDAARRPAESAAAADRQGRHQGRRQAVGQGLERFRSVVHRRERADRQRQQDRCRGGLQRRHRRRRHPGAGRAEAGRQGAGVRPGRRPGRRQPRDRRHPGDDGLQAAQADRDEAARLSVQLVRNQKPAYNSTYENGFKKVSTLLLAPIALTKANVNVLSTTVSTPRPSCPPTKESVCPTICWK